MQRKKMRSSILHIPAAFVLAGCCSGVQRCETVDVSGVTRVARRAEQLAQAEWRACGGGDVQRRAALDLVRKVDVNRCACNRERVFLPV